MNKNIEEGVVDSGVVNVSSRRLISEDLQETVDRLQAHFAVVNIISTPYGGDGASGSEREVRAKAAGARMADEVTRNHSDSLAKDKVFTFNPNTDLSKFAHAAGLTKKEQAARWVELWSKVLGVAQQKKAAGSKVFVMQHKGEYIKKDGILGDGQRGEITAARNAGFNEEDGSLVFVEYAEDCDLEAEQRATTQQVQAKPKQVQAKPKATVLTHARPATAAVGAGSHPSGSALKAVRSTEADRKDILNKHLDDQLKTMRSYTRVNVISTPWDGGCGSSPIDEAKRRGAQKAAEIAKKNTTKLNPRSSITEYTFNPNTALRDFAQSCGMGDHESVSRWVEMWSMVLQVCKDKRDQGSKVFVMRHKDKTLGEEGILGKAQQAEIVMAKGYEFVEGKDLIFVDFN